MAYNSRYFSSGKTRINQTLNHLVKNEVKIKNRDIVGAIIVNEKNEILLQKKTIDYKFSSGGCWTFFGGEIKGNESPEQALKREIKEEINYDIKNFYLFKVGSYRFPSAGLKGKKYIFVVFFDGDISQISLHEGGGFGFFSIPELNYIKIHNLILKDLKEYTLQPKSSR